MRKTTRLLLGSVLLTGALLNTGCAVVAVGAGTAAVAAANDPRSMGTQIDDQTAKSKIGFALSDTPELEVGANVDVLVFNGVALLTGQTTSESQRQLAEKAARSVSLVHKVHNQIRIGQPISAGTQANDIWLSSKVRSLLLADDQIESINLSITVQDSEVFLMGLVTSEQASLVVEKVRNIEGVARVVKAFEIV